MFVNPSSSARCTQLPRAIDKVPFYEALKRVRDHIRVHGSINGIDRSTVTFPDFKLVTAPQKAKKEVKEEPREITDSNGQAPTDSNQQAATAKAAPSATKAATPKAAKPKKPRGRPKREKAGAVGAVPSSAAPTSSAAPALTNGIQSNNQQPFSHNALPSQRTELPLNNTKQLLQNGQAGPDYTNIKLEAIDPNHHDKDLAAIIQQSINVQQSMLQQQHQSMTTANSIPHSINGSNTGMLVPPSSSSAVKQERPDWNGYGVMPAYTSGTPTTMAAYPQYPCYWNYLPTSNSFMTNGYSAIPAPPQIAHQQAVAAAAALHTSVAASQANATNGVAPAAVSYNSPQEASSPAMSSQSNLTQASLDSLPKADSASTVANWLQSIPHS